MADKMKAATIPIEERAPVPVSLRIETELRSNGWKQVHNLPRHGDTRRASGRLASWHRALGMLSLTLVVAAAPASAQSGSGLPTVQAIVERMGQARTENRARFRPYVVTRNYQLFGKDQYKTKSQVIADVTFVPPASKKYAIEQTSGGGLGERIVRRMLQSEAEVAKDYSSTDISPDNYDFRFLRDEQVSGEQRHFVLAMLPRRKEKNLLRGEIWIDANTYLLHRVEGEPAKLPSWWLREVRIVLRYSDVDGMWLQTASEATAKVRIFGPHRIVSYDVKYDLGQLVARGPSPPPIRQQAPGESLGNILIQDRRTNLFARKESSTWSSTGPFSLR